MIPRKNRLSVALFPRNGAAVLRLREATVKFVRNEGPGNRIGIIVSKAVDRRSTVRHAVKRQIARAMLALPARGADVLVVAARAMSAGNKTERRIAADRIAQEIIKRTP